MSKRSAIRALALATTAALSVAGAASAQSIELKLAHFLPTANGMHSDFMEPWARALEECSQGEVKVEIFPAGTQLGNPARLYDAVRAGAVGHRPRAQRHSGRPVRTHAHRGTAVHVR